MLRAAGARRRRAAVALALVAVLGGCGGDEFANDPPPAPSIIVSAVVTAKGVTVSPARFGAGTVELLASNQTGRSQRVQLRSERLAAGGTPLAQTTGPISPGGTASLKAGLAAGRVRRLRTLVEDRARDDRRRLRRARAGADRLLQP